MNYNCSKKTSTTLVKKVDIQSVVINIYLLLMSEFDDSDADLENPCSICYDNEVSGIILVLHDDAEIESKCCLTCFNIAKNTRLNNFINTLSKETCIASIKRMIKNPLPTTLSEFGSGPGRKLKSIKFKDEEIDAKLLSKYSEEKLEEINAKILILKDMINSEDDIFLTTKEELLRNI